MGKRSIFSILDVFTCSSEDFNACLLNVLVIGEKEKKVFPTNKMLEPRLERTSFFFSTD